MRGRRLRLPWHPEPVREQVPNEAELDPVVHQHLIMGMVDADGDVQSFIPVGGVVSALPPLDDLHTLTSATLGATATITSDPIDMTEYQDLYLEWSVGTARDINTELQCPASGPITPASKLQYARDENNGIVDVLTDIPAASINVRRYVIRNVGGTTLEVKWTNNDALTAGTLTCRYRRINRLAVA